MPWGKRLRQSITERFWAKVEKKSPEGCWEWIGAKTQGYGNLKVNGITVKASRLAYEMLVGLIPPGKELDHLCRNRACVNPAHTEPVSKRENILRGIGRAACKARQTHCIYGHPFDAVNTHIRSCGRRECLRCRQRRNKEAWERERKVKWAMADPPP